MNTRILDGIPQGEPQPAPQLLVLGYSELQGSLRFLRLLLFKSVPQEKWTGFELVYALSK